MKVKVVIKFISKVHHMGSEEATISRVAEQSKAAGKINMMLGASVKLKVSSKPKVSDDRSTHVIKHELELDSDDAVLLVNELFNTVKKEGNSQRYTERKAAFDTAKNEVLARFGVRDYTDLTSDQKKIYAQEMISRKAPFDYTERSIHVRIDDMQTVYSGTQRKLGVAHFENGVLEKFENKLPVLREKYSVKYRKGKTGSV